MKKAEAIKKYGNTKAIAVYPLSMDSKIEIVDYVKTDEEEYVVTRYIFHGNLKSYNKAKIHNVGTGDRYFVKDCCFYYLYQFDWIDKSRLP